MCAELNESRPGLDWALYRNARFGTVLCVPAALFEALPPPANRDGRTFASIPDGRSELLVWAGHNVFLEDLPELEARARAARRDARLTYAARGESWFVLSGYLGEEIFYDRHQLAPDGEVIHAFAITYPASQRHLFDPVVEGLSASFGIGGPTGPAPE